VDSPEGNPKLLGKIMSNMRDSGRDTVAAFSRLKLASRFVYHMSGGWKGMLLQFALLFSFLGMLGGVAVDPFLRWIGHPPKDSQPVWFTISCAVAFLIIFLFEAFILRKRTD
jgi:hypothetical protein